MAQTAATLPRFLLPQTGAIWRRPASGGAARLGGGGRGRRTALAVAVAGMGAGRRRLESTKATADEGGGGEQSSDGRVLAKPDQFRPPSHGARLPRRPFPIKHYGGTLGPHERDAVAGRSYPGLPPAEAVWMERWYNNINLHAWFCIAVLMGAVFYGEIAEIRATSPFFEFVPSFSELARHPLLSAKRLVECYLMHHEWKRIGWNQDHQADLDDVTKMQYYRLAHGQSHLLNPWSLVRIAEWVGITQSVVDATEEELIAMLKQKDDDARAVARESPDVLRSRRGIEPGPLGQEPSQHPPPSESAGPVEPSSVPSSQTEV